MPYYPPASSSGTSIVTGIVNPTSGDGNDGDFFLNTTSRVLFGPKASGAWPANGEALDGNLFFMRYANMFSS